jgi:hypothetical protein
LGNITSDAIKFTLLAYIPDYIGIKKKLIMRGKIMWIPLCIVLLLYIVFSEYHRRIRNREMVTNLGISCARISDIGIGAHSTRVVYYTFTYENQQIRGMMINSSLASYGSNVKNFIGKHFITVFDTTDTKYSKLIMDTESLKKIQINYS